MNLFLLDAGAIIGIVVGCVLGVIVIVVVAIIVWWIKTMNWFNRMVEQVNESLSGIDVALTKRFDLLTKQLGVVKGYAKHEYETLTKTIEARRPSSQSTLADKEASANAMTDVLRQLSVVVESYPNLKADAQFTSLSNQIVDIEEQLQAARRLYNSNVKYFNQRLVTWPASIVGKHYGHSKFEFFEAEESKRADVKIEF
jgi:LemA protein